MWVAARCAAVVVAVREIYGGMGVIGVVWTLLLKFWDKMF